MNAYWTFALLIVLVLVQTSVVPQFAPFGARPDLLLIVVTAWSLLRGTEEGMLWALVAGVAMDVVSGAPFGMSTLPLLIISFGTGLTQRGMFRFDLVIPILIIPVATLIYQAIMVVWLKISGWPITWGEAANHLGLSGVLVNTLLMPAVYWLLRLISRRTERMTRI